MLINRIDHDIKLICIELELNKKELAERINTSSKYVNKIINMKVSAVAVDFVRAVEKLGYDIQIEYIERNDKNND